MKYLVNKETKEHIVFHADVSVPYPQWSIVEADSEGWIPWNGGKCPLPDDAECVIETPVSKREMPKRKAEHWCWSHDAVSPDHRIVSYRPILAEKEEWSGYVDADDDQQQVTAASILKSALGHMEDRAATYDSQGGERSIGKVVEIFNTLTGHELTDEQGWLFMICLKLVRSQQGGYRADSYEDGAAYFALGGESAAKERGKGGSAAIKREAEHPAEGMTDWRNWKEGDLVTAHGLRGGYTENVFPENVPHTIVAKCLSGFDVKSSNGDVLYFNGREISRGELKFHSRPAKELPRG